MDNEPPPTQEISTTVEDKAREKFSTFYSNAKEILKKSNHREEWTPTGIDSTEEKKEVFIADFHDLNINGTTSSVEMTTEVDKGADFLDDPELIELDILFPGSENQNPRLFNITYMTRAEFA